MRTLKKTVFLSALAVFLLFQAWASPSKDSKQTGSKEISGTLEFWSVFTGADSENMQRIVDSYNAANPAFKVNHRAMADTDLYLKLPLAVQSGQDIPDIAINHVERIKGIQATGILMDIGPYLASAGIKAENYNAALWNISNLQNGHYAIPLDSTAYMLFVNMDLYNKYGGGALDDGYLTFDEIKAAGATAKRDGILALSNFSWYRTFASIYGLLGGNFSTDDKTPDYNDANARKALSLLKELHDLGYTPKEGESGRDLFLGGKVIFCPDGTWILNAANQSGVNYKVVDSPVFEKGQMGHWASSHNFVIPKDSKRSEERIIAALKFMDYFGNNSYEWAKGGQIPAHNSIQSNAEFNKLPHAFVAKQPASAFKVFTYQYYGNVTDSLGSVVPEIIFGRLSIDDGLNKSVREVKDRIAAGN
jgi:multiple sugar transport system substrate-binding protein